MNSRFDPPQRETKTPTIPPIVKSIAGGILALLALIVFLTTYFTVGQNERAVVSSWGKFSYVAEPGLHFKVPFRDSTKFYRNDIQSYSPAKAVNTYTVDNQEIDIIFTVFYRIPPDRVQYVYENARDYDALLFKLAEDRLKAEMGKINTEHVAENRGKIRDAIKTTMLNDAKTLGVDVTDFQLTNLEYSKGFRDAVEAAARAKAGIQTRENERQQAEKVAQTKEIQARGEANGVREKAKGDADARVLVATAEAKAIQMQGEAQAKAIEAQAKALASNAQLVELKKAEKWDGELPKQLLSGVVPFMQFNPPALPVAEKK